MLRRFKLLRNASENGLLLLRLLHRSSFICVIFYPNPVPEWLGISWEPPYQLRVAVSDKNSVRSVKAISLMLQFAARAALLYVHFSQHFY
jgi:hypothetical protein